MTCKYTLFGSIAAASGIGLAPKNDRIEGFCYGAVTSDLDFDHPKGASLDTVNVVSPTPCIRLYVPHECCSLCFAVIHLFPILDSLPR